VAGIITFGLASVVKLVLVLVQAPAPSPTPANPVGSATPPPLSGSR
jgi:hypothetical protein